MSRWNGYVMCNGEISLQHIIDCLVGRLFNGSQTMRHVLSERYVKMCANFGRSDLAESDWNQNGCSYKCERGCSLLGVEEEKVGFVNPTQRELFQHPGLGLDMPTWIGQSEPNRPTRCIMVIGQDPRRDTENAPGKLWLSSPFGCHDEEYQETGTRVSDIIKSLVLTYNAIVYTTDFFKFYTADHYVMDNISDYHQWFKDVLDAEMEIVKPDMILSLGSLVFDCMFRMPIRNFTAFVTNDGHPNFISYGGHPCCVCYHPSWFNRLGLNKHEYYVNSIALHPEWNVAH